MLFKFLVLIMKSLGRNKVRTSLTGMGVVVLVAIYAVVTSVTSTVKRKMAAQGEETRLIVSERWTMPSRMPLRYVNKIAELDGVKDWTTWNIFVGFLDESRRSDRQAGVIATRPENIATMHGGLADLDPAVLERFESQKDGALVGPGLMAKMNWQVGQEFTMLGARFPPVDIRFTVIGVLPAGDWSNTIFCRHDYYMDATEDRDAVNCVWLEVDGESRAKKLAATLMSDYENQQPALKVETESAGVARFAARSMVILRIIDGVVAVLLLDMVIILSNSISISVRERQTEMAVLKVLGFQPLHIAWMVIGEAMLVGGIAGLLGTGMVCLVSELTLGGWIPTMGWNSFLLQFPVPWSTAGWGLLLGAAVGLTGSIFPAMAARKVKVSDVFSRAA